MHRTPSSCTFCLPPQLCAVNSNSAQSGRNLQPEHWRISLLCRTRGSQRRRRRPLSCRSITNLARTVRRPRTTRRGSLCRTCVSPPIYCTIGLAMAMTRLERWRTAVPLLCRLPVLQGHHSGTGGVCPVQGDQEQAAAAGRHARAEKRQLGAPTCLYQGGGRHQ